MTRTGTLLLEKARQENLTYVFALVKAVDRHAFGFHMDVFNAIARPAGFMAAATRRSPARAHR